MTDYEKIDSRGTTIYSTMHNTFGLRHKYHNNCTVVTNHYYNDAFELLSKDGATIPTCTHIFPYNGKTYYIRRVRGWIHHTPSERSINKNKFVISINTDIIYVVDPTKLTNRLVYVEDVDTYNAILAQRSKWNTMLNGLKCVRSTAYIRLPN